VRSAVGHPTLLANEKRLKRWHRDWKIELVEKANPEWDNLFDSLM
tara:strand:+ start:457 stop:591 length:135 start_codon:yes stop_codon:yes gene_type:complete